MKIKCIYILLSLSFLSLYTNGQNSFSYKYTENSLSIIKTFDVFDTNRTRINNKEYYIINTEEETYKSFEVGRPSLPIYTLLLNIPADKNVSIKENIIEKEEIQLNNNIKIIPQQASHIKNNPDSPFIIDEKYYNTDTFSSLIHTSIENKGMFLGQNLSLIKISPIRYNPRKNIIEFVRKIEIEVFFENKKEKNTVLNNKLSRISEEFFKSSVIPNKEIANSSLNNIPYTLVILSPENYSQTLQPFISWKRKQGFNVIQLYTENIGNNPVQIKNHLQSLYENSERPFDYLLICGDIEQVASFAANSEFADDGIHYTDLYYVEYTSDALPEALYGRISAKDTLELKNILDKTIKYETYNLIDDEYLDKSLLVAGAESQNNARKTTNGQLNYAKQYLALLSDTSIYYNPQSFLQENNIKTEINNGKGWVNYTAHCNELGWYNPNVNTDFINSINNLNKYGIFINNCCLAGKYDEQECFSESLIKQINKGAVASIGASDYTMWEEDYYWAVGSKTISLNPMYNANKLGVYDRFFHNHNEPKTEQAKTLGQMLSSGVISVLQSNSPYYSYYSEIYNLQGDPTLVPYVGKGKTIVSNYPHTIPIGTQNLSFLSEPYSYICLSKQDSIVVVSKADSNGFVNIDISTITELCTLDLVITSQFCRPTIDSISFVSPQNGYISLSDIKFSDTFNNEVNKLKENTTYIISLKLKNVGNKTFVFNPNSLQLKNQNEDIILIDSICSLISLGAGQETYLNSAFTFKTNPAIKDNKKIFFPITIKENNNTQREQNIFILTEAPELSIEDFYLSFLNNDSIEAGFYVINKGTLQSEEGFVSIRNMDKSFIIASLTPQGKQQINIYLNRSLHTDSIVFDVIYTAGNYLSSKIFCLAMNSEIESFENNNIFSYTEWENDGYKPWIIDSAFTFSGRYSFRSSPYISSNGTSEFSLTLYSLVDDSISFYSKVSSEQGQDIFNLFIDQENVLELSGYRDWEYQSFPLSKGNHNLVFSYSKDNWVNIGYDATWIDDIKLPHKGYISVCLDEKEKTNQVNIFPNPTSSFINIEGIQQHSSIYLYDIDGKLRYISKDNNSSKRININFLENGIYYILLINNNKVYYTNKLIINKK